MARVARKTIKFFFIINIMSTLCEPPCAYIHDISINMYILIGIHMFLALRGTNPKHQNQNKK